MVLFKIKKKILERRLGLTKKITKVRTKIAKQNAELDKIKKKISKAKQLDLTPNQRKVLMAKQKKAMAQKKALKKSAKIVGSKVLRSAKLLAKELSKLDAVQGSRSKPKRKRKKKASKKRKR